MIFNMPIRKLSSLSNHPKIQAIVTKYNIPQEYLVFNKKSVSNAVFIGLFIAMIPMPMQMLLVIAMMSVFRFNVAVGLLMCWVSNPFTMPFMYYLEYLTGSFILGQEAGEFELNLEWFTQNIDLIFIPLYTGTLVFSVVTSLIGYLLVKKSWNDNQY